MSDDLVRRLRDVYLSEENGRLCHRAADRIAELEAENARLREALAEAAGALDASGEELSEFANILSRDPWQANQTYESAVQARAALTHKEPKP